MANVRKTTVAGSLLVALALVAASTAAVAQGRGRCAVTEMYWAFALPDGSTFDGGRLRICLADDYTPTAGLHVVHVDNRPVGMLMSQARGSEQSGDSRPALLFRRDTQGMLVLAGYVWPDSTLTRSFELHAFGPGSAGRVASVEGTGEAGGPIRVAARFE